MIDFITVYCDNEKCPEYGDDRDLDKGTEAVETYDNVYEWTCPVCGTEHETEEKYSDDYGDRDDFEYSDRQYDIWAHQAVGGYR